MRAGEKKKVLLTGGCLSRRWTCGDLELLMEVKRWLEKEGIAHDVTRHRDCPEGVDFRKVRPEEYSDVVFVCGPVSPHARWQSEIWERFSHCRRVGVNVSLIKSPAIYNPFDAVLVRDSSEEGRPDGCFLLETTRVPVVGVILVHSQREYGNLGRHDRARELINGAIHATGVAAVELSTQLGDNGVGLQTTGQFESMLCRLDAVLTTRLHGTVFALKNGVPPVVIDPIAGGAKVSAQARTVEWPHLFNADTATEKQVADALLACLRPEAKKQAAKCVTAQKARLATWEDEFFKAFQGKDSQRTKLPPIPKPASQGRTLLGRLMRRASLLLPLFQSGNF